MWYHIFCVSALLCVCFYGSVVASRSGVAARHWRVSPHGLRCSRRGQWPVATGEGGSSGFTVNS
ncbi:hypothetical protein PR003_g17700 [Phytophthora rubi]|uniref:RxLR effector protein n=1 Tax=Phytophthora rubi TaxID=129364 RepID=A0A6A3KHC5_9STRA|nr:hypothetical protein PR002_g16913 [Phytophthora rubi]KAE9007674.1 hypothetical protein PR001_g16911 [Phytophthora rubi]KAE9320514.1 hypothetical protein PR003_g17700 [Phytophthora rubi]